MRRRILRKLLKPFRKFFWICFGYVDVKIFKREYIYYDRVGMIGTDGFFDPDGVISVYHDRRYGRTELSGFNLCGPWISVKEKIVNECIGVVIEIIQHEIVHDLVSRMSVEGDDSGDFDSIAQFIIADDVLDWMVKFYGYDSREELLKSY